MATGDSVGSRETSDKLAYLIGGSEETYAYECDACKLDEEIKEGKFYCCTCEDYLCSQCESFHKKVKVTRSHEIVDADDAPHKSYSDKTTQKDSERLSTYEFCSCNQRKTVEFYCEEHSEVLCSMCMNVHHNGCSAESIVEVSSAEDFPDKVKSTVEKLETLEQKANDIEEKSNDALIDLEKMEHACKRDINEMRKQVALLFDKLQQNALDELKSKSNEQSNILKDLNTVVKNTAHLLNTDKCKVGEIKSSNQDKLVAYSKINKVLPSYEAALETCQVKLVMPSVTFQKNPILTSLLVNLDSLGSISSLSRHENSKTNFLDSEVTRHTIIDVKDITDSETPWITGTDFLNNGDLLVADHKNGRIILFDKALDNKKTSSLKCSCPWDIAVVDENQVLVTCSDNLKFINVELNGGLTFTEDIKLGKKANRGMAVKAGLIYVVNRDGKNCIKILSSAGTLQKTLELEHIQEEYWGPNNYYIVTSCMEDQLYLQTDTRVLAITTDGDFIRTNSYSDMKGARGIVVDEQDNLLVCCIKSHNLHIFSSDGTKHKTLLPQKDQIAKPYSVAFRASDGTLAVGDWDTGKLHILTLRST